MKTVKKEDKKPVHVKIAGTRCIFHTDCTCYGIHLKTCERIHLASDSVVHVHEIGRMIR